MGTSAGGHLAIALAAHLLAVGREAPPLALCSPGVDMAGTYDFPQQGTSDFVVTSRRKISRPAIMRWYTPDAPQLPLFSPTLSAKGTWAAYGAPVLVSVGTAETGALAIQAFVRRLREDGVEVDVYAVGSFTAWEC